MRKGFSLVEALVALALFQIGMLALAATTIVAARDLGSSARRARAASIAALRVERIRISACDDGSRTGESLGQQGFRESWRVTATDRRRSISDSVSFQLPTGRESHVVARGDVLCAP